MTKYYSLLKSIVKYPVHKWNKFKKENADRHKYQKYGFLTKIWLDNPNIKVGDYTYGIPNISAYTSKYSIEIGRFCSIAQGVTLIVGGMHNYHHVSQYGVLEQLKQTFNYLDYQDKPVKPIRIGNDVWIGQGATIMQGVNIGDGAVIGAKAVITKDIPPYAIVVGNPARIIKYRFEPETIEALMRIKWWNWPIEKIVENFPLIMSDKIPEFIDKFDN